MKELLETLIGEWRSYVSRANGVGSHDVEELETHLRDQIIDLGESGLAPDEAFLIAVKRIGDIDDLSREFAREHGGRLWRQFAMPAGPEPELKSRGFAAALAFAIVAAVAIHLPRLLAESSAALESIYLRNAGLLVLPLLAWYFARRKRLSLPQVATATIPFAITALLINLYPWEGESSTELLASLHLPVFLWFAVGYPYMSAAWRSHERRMDFVRFTGEWFIYYVLIALGGGVLIGLTVFILEPAGADVVDAVIEWVVPSGAAGAVIVAAWLVEAKQSVIENMAPVLTTIFTPLFALMLSGVAIAYAVLGLGDEFDREVIGVFDLLLIVVLGLLLYRISARPSTQPAGWMDRIQLVALVAALALDAMVLGSMIDRIIDLGITPNRAAALGLNIVLLVNLVWAAWLSARFIGGVIPFHPVERWQTSYLAVLASWTALVVVLLPPLFGFA
ncbi:MAG: permease prefix domain 1-containing protein [Acidimicrobiia bacterium]